MRKPELLSKIVGGVRARDKGSLPDKLKRGVRLLSETANASGALKGCEGGAGARVGGRLHVENHGRIVIGRGLNVHAESLPVDFYAGPGAQLEIGDDVWINFGVVIAAGSKVKIGDRVMIGQHSIVSDVDVPELAADLGDSAKPIVIGDDVWIAGRVTVLPGVTIGARTVITAGSIVASDLPEGVIAGGNPARILRTIDAAEPAPEAEAPPATTQNTCGHELPKATVEPIARGFVAADFTVDELSEFLALPMAEPPIEACFGGFGQVAQALLAPPETGFGDFILAWTRPESIVPSFERVLRGEPVAKDVIDQEVDDYCKLIGHAAAAYRIVIVPTWVVPTWIRGSGLMDSRSGGVRRTLAEMNLRLMSQLEQHKNVFVLPAERWQADAAAPASPRAWFMGKIAFPRQMLREAARDIRAAVGAATIAPRKLLVLDLDETLWGGIVGDVGWENLRLGGHDAVGEALVDFQRSIKALKRRGILLAVVSKNTESVALEAIEKHPEMILRKEDFVTWRINWQDKAQNIADLTRELNLGLQSVVFIDDNPVERARVRDALPEVFVPEWPKDHLEYVKAFASLTCFDSPYLTAEDAERGTMYQQEKQREALQQQLGSVDEWLHTLGLRLRAEPLSTTNLTRAAQLLNKTNQMNLTTRRLTEAELKAWAEAPNHRFYVVHVSDKFGDSGLTGLLGLEVNGTDAHIIDFVLSCRVMGRRVEETLLHLASEFGRERGATRLIADYIETAKNKPCLEFFERSGLTRDGSRFSAELHDPLPLPSCISLDFAR